MKFTDSSISSFAKKDRCGGKFNQFSIVYILLSFASFIIIEIKYFSQDQLNENYKDQFLISIQCVYVFYAYMYE